MKNDDVFLDAQGKPRLVRGVTMYGGSPRIAELAARVGWETVWVEMEHGPTDFAVAESICMAVESAGAFATLRVPDGQRHHILRALEAGARIVVVPMIHDAEQARQVVEYGKFPPLGLRGYNTRTRGVGYGLRPVKESFEQANARTHLFAQIETPAACENLGSICDVPGLSGILVGPGDLSASLGITGDLNCPKMVSIVTDCIRRARAAHKHAGILVGPGALLDAAIAAGCDLIFCGGDISELAVAWTKLLPSVGTGQS